MTVLKLSLLICFLLSTAYAINLCPTGCKSCNILLQCSACNKGYTLKEKNCYQCAPDCDSCEVVKQEGSKYWTQCTGSCQGACQQCSSDFKCTKCSTGSSVMNGRCVSCQGECDKCSFTPNGSDSYWINCLGSCKGGCDACSYGDTCTRCRSGYVLNNGVCYACNGCSKCTFVQVTATSYRTECVYEPKPTPKPTPTPTPDPEPNQDDPNNNGNQDVIPTNSNNMAPMIFFGCIVVILITAIFCFCRKSADKKNNNNIYQQFYNEKQQYAAMGNPQFPYGQQPYSQYQQPPINGVPPPQYQQYPGAWNPQQDMLYSPQYYQQGYPAQNNTNQGVGAKNVNEKGQVYAKLPTKPEAAVLVGNQPENKRSDDAAL